MIGKRQLVEAMVVVALAASLGVRACNFPNGDALVTIGDETLVCLVRDNQEYVLSRPRADQYSRITLPGSFAANFAAGGCKEELFHVESLGVQSEFRKRFCAQQSQETTLYFPVLTAILQVDEGKLVNITWDDGCYFTDGSVSSSVQDCVTNAYAINSTAALEMDEVEPPARGSDTGLTQESCDSELDFFCDLAVYIAWTGRDKNGNYFASAGRRFRIFRDYALQPQYDAMRLFLLNEK